MRKAEFKRVKGKGKWLQENIRDRKFIRISPKQIKINKAILNREERRYENSELYKNSRDDEE